MPHFTGGFYDCAYDDPFVCRVPKDVPWQLEIKENFLWVAVTGKVTAVVKESDRVETFNYDTFTFVVFDEFLCFALNFGHIYGFMRGAL